MQGQSQRGGMRGGRRGFGGPSRGGDGANKQGQTRRGTTTTPQAVANMRANIANKLGTKYSDQLRDAITRSNEAARERSLEGRKRRAALEAIQAQEAKQVSPTAAGIEGMISRMDNERRGLMGLAADNQITNRQLNRLGELNQAIGLNRTSGMGPIESIRDTVSNPAFRADLSRAAKTYQKISPLGILASSFLGRTGESLRSLIASQRANDLSRLGKINQAISTGRGQGTGALAPRSLPKIRKFFERVPGASEPQGVGGGPFGKLLSKIGDQLVSPNQPDLTGFAPGYGDFIRLPDAPRDTSFLMDQDNDGIDDRFQRGPGRPDEVTDLAQIPGAFNSLMRVTNPF